MKTITGSYMVFLKFRSAFKIWLVRRIVRPDLSPVNFTKTFSTFLAIFCVGHTSVSAQGADPLEFVFQAGTTANFRQNPTETRFEGGTYNLFVRDGILIFQAGCLAPFYFPPGGPCPIGANGFLTAGDLDGDGLEDAGTYFSVLNIARARILRPFRPEQVRLISAPPSLLPRPLAGLTSDSRSAFFDIQTPFISQFDITIYGFEREYTSEERGRFDDEIVPGAYTYSFPSLASETIPQNISLNRFATLDGYRKVNNQRVGFRFLDVTYDDGFAVLNPFQINTLTWEGNNLAFISPGVDLLYLSIRRLQDPTDPLSDPEEGDPIFPNFTGNPTERRVLLPSALNNSYSLAPNFIAPGQSGLLELEFEIIRRTNSVVFDLSVHRFRLPVRVTNPFAIPPPPEVSEAVFNDPDGDFDNDGISNFDEWVFNSDRADASSIPVAPKLGFVSAPATSPAAASGFATDSEPDSNDAGAWEFKVNKKRNAVPKLKYEIQRSSDMVNWTTIKADDPDWILVDDDVKSEIKITSRSRTVTGGDFFRAKVSTQ